MDAAAYLINQGWRGDGHALHHSGRGITKPIHMSKKANVLGVGKREHDAHADQWWARAFDDTLKGLNTTKNEATGKIEESALGSDAQALQMVAGNGGAKWVGQRGLYRNFVRGESLSGTLTSEEKNDRETQSQSEDQKKWTRISNDLDHTAAATKDVERSNRKRRQQKEDITEYSEMAGVDALQQDPKDVTVEKHHQKPRERPKDTETKAQRRQRKREKKARRGLDTGESGELPEQPRAIVINDALTSNSPKRRTRNNCT